MKRRSLVLAAPWVCISGIAGTPVRAAEASVERFPERPVRVIVPYGAGGAADILARAMASKLAEIWGQSVVVENRPGGVGTIGIMAAIKSPPDGYTLASIPVSDLAVNPHLYKTRPFDVRKDLSPVSQVGAVPNVLVVSPNLGADDANALIAKARGASPALSYSSPGIGSQAHLLAEIFAEKAGARLLHVPYNSVSTAVTDVAAGQVSMMFCQLPAAMPFIKGNRVKALGIASEKRSPLYPELPTIREITGLSLGDAISWSGLMAPAGTPLELRQKIAVDVTRAMQSRDVQDKLALQGTVGLGGTPDALDKAIDADSLRYGAVIKTMNISLE